jgi:hypothetical protein
VERAGRCARHHHHRPPAQDDRRPCVRRKARRPAVRRRAHAAHHRGQLGLRSCQAPAHGAGPDLALCERPHQCAGARAAACGRDAARALCPVAARGAVHAARHAQRHDRARRRRYARRFVLHARQPARLAAVRAVPAAGWHLAGAAAGGARVDRLHAQRHAAIRSLTTAAPATRPLCPRTPSTWWDTKASCSA